MTARAEATGDDRSNAGLVLDDVSVRYGETPIIDGLSLIIQPGEVLAVVGPSGSGKSTLLRAVAGLEPLAGGSIRLGGRDLDGVATHHRGLGLMFQDHGLFAHLDVADNIGYGLRIAKASSAAQTERVAELVALVGLEGLEDRRVDQLSGGEAQRVALARALAPEPGLLMLDEPLGSLDRALREQLTGDLRNLLSSLGQTAIHVTHDQSEAFAVADRVAVIDGGRLVALGEPAQLWSDPGSVFVARFLGHPNRWTVTIDDGGVVRIGSEGMALIELGTVGADHELRSAMGDPVEVVLPATAVSLAADAGTRVVGPSPARSDGAVDGLVEVVVDEVVFDQGRHRIRARLLVGAGQTDRPDADGSAVEFDAIERIEVGQRCWIRLDLGALRPLRRP